LIPVLLQNDPYQLTACPDSGFRKELLERRFYGTLGNADPRGNFLIGEAFEYKREDLPFPFGESSTSSGLRSGSLLLQRSLQLRLVEPNCSSAA
jgi:hypothetical protein